MLRYVVNTPQSESRPHVRLNNVHRLALYAPDVFCHFFREGALEIQGRALKKERKWNGWVTVLRIALVENFEGSPWHFRNRYVLWGTTVLKSRR